MRAKSLFQNESIKYLSKKPIKFIKNNFNLDFFSDFNALLAKIETNKTIKKNIKVVTTVFEIYQLTCSHCIAGICGHECISVCVQLV